MNIAYKVFSVHAKNHPMPAKLAHDGSNGVAHVDMLEVQLVPTDDHHGQSGTIKLAIIGDESIAQGEELFTDGAVINVAFTKE